MPSAGDIDMTHDFFLLPTSKNTTAAIAKGDIVTLSAGRKWEAGDTGPYGVATQAIGSGKDMKGKVLVDGVVWVVADDAIDQYSAVVPTAAAKVSAQPGITVTISGATGTSGFLLAEIAYDAAAKDGDLIRVDL